MKKLILAVFFIGCIVISQAGKVEKTYTFSSWSVEQKEGYQLIRFPNTMPAGLTGEPMLAYHPVSLILPPGEKAVSIVIRGEGLTEIPGSFDLYPQQFSQPLSESRPADFQRRDAVYALYGRYPVSATGNLINSALNGYGFAMSTFTPMIYNPALKKVSYYKTVTVSIETAPDISMQESVANLTSSEAALQRVRQFAQNQEAMDAYPSVDSPASAYQVLIITAAQFQSGFQPLVDFYSGKGLTCEMTTVESIESMTGQDLPEKIRNYIKSEYQASGIEHVILGGDVEYVPYRGFYCYVVSGSGYEDNNIPADLYYSALDGNWNTNGNFKWGEPGEDDLLPEISVGRMSFSNASELSNMVHKSVTYQTNPGGWEMNKPYLVSEFLYEPPLTWGSDYLELLVDDHNDNGYFTYGIPSAINSILRLYDAPGYNWSVGELLEDINEGQSFIHHSGHSNSNYMMRLYNWDITNQNFSSVNGIDHNYQLMYTHGCICGAFDDNDCIAEVATTIDNFLAGGVFNSRYGWFNQGQTEGPSAHLHREFISAVYHPDPSQAIQEIGAAHTMSKIKTAPWVGLPGEFEPGAQRWCFYDCNVLGDPAMKVWRNNQYVGLPETSAGIIVTLSPNPCSDVLVAKAFGPKNGTVAFELLNALGQVVGSYPGISSPAGQSSTIDVTSFPEGIYFCRTTSSLGSTLTKLVITR